MIHLSFLLLILQYRSLFIFYHFIIIIYHFYLSLSSVFSLSFILFISFFHPFVFFIIIIIHFIILHFSSPYRYSVVNVVLVFNDSLIILAPDSPILLAAHLEFFHSSIFRSVSLNDLFSLNCQIQ